MPRTLRLAAIAGLGLAFLWFFPLFRIVPIKPAAAESAAFDAQTVAAEVWKNQIPAAVDGAADLRDVSRAIRQNLAAATNRFGRSVGVGVAYYFVHGSGRIVAKERNYLRVAVDGADQEVVSIRIGPVFGNAIRDGFGLFDVNDFSGLEQFNELSAALNAHVDTDVTSTLRTEAEEGAVIRFAGCATAPESLAERGEPILIIIPVEAEML